MDSLKIFKYIIAINVGIVLLFVVFVAGLKLYQTLGPDKDPAVSQTPENQKTEEQIERENLDIVSSAVSGGNFSECQNIADDYYKTICINNIASKLAKETGDISYCERLDDEMMSIKSCKKSVIHSQLLTKSDASICNLEETQTEIQACQNNYYRNMAIKSLDNRYCQEISDESLINECLDSVFIKNDNSLTPKNLDCGLFFSLEAKNDCNLFLEENPPYIPPNYCSKFESNAFRDLCLKNQG